MFLFGTILINTCTALLEQSWTMKVVPALNDLFINPTNGSIIDPPMPFMLKLLLKSGELKQQQITL